jgi:hypothetical protein
VQTGGFLFGGSSVPSRSFALASRAPPSGRRSANEGAEGARCATVVGVGATEDAAGSCEQKALSRPPIHLILVTRLSDQHHEPFIRALEAHRNAPHVTWNNHRRAHRRVTVTPQSVEPVRSSQPERQRHWIPIAIVLAVALAIYLLVR